MSVWEVSMDGSSAKVRNRNKVRRREKSHLLDQGATVLRDVIVALAEPAFD